MDLWTQPNPWILNVCGGTIAAVVGGLVLALILGRERFEPGQAAGRVMVFLFLQVAVVIVALLTAELMAGREPAFGGLFDRGNQPSIIGDNLFLIGGTLINMAGLIFGYDTLAVFFERLFSNMFGDR